MLFSSDARGRHVLVGADEGFGHGLRRRELARDAKIGDLGLAFGIEEDILRFNVAMNNVHGLVQIGQPLQQLRRQFAEHRFGQLAAAGLHQTCQGTAIHVLQHKRDHAF